MISKIKDNGLSPGRSGTRDSLFHEPSSSKSVFERVWNKCKRWRAIPIGPISFVFRLSRSAPVSSNARRVIIRKLRPRGPRGGSALFAQETVTNSNVSPPEVVETALIVGTGPGLGFALARRLVASGMNVALASRRAELMDPLVRELRLDSNREIEAYGCDATSESSVKSLFSLVSAEIGIPSLVVYSVQGHIPGRALEMEVSAFEECWRHNCLGAFIVAQQAAKSMVPHKRGTIVLIGSTSGMVGRANHLNLAVGKFGLRALAQVMARELWPCGIHVVHLVIDADIREEGSEPDTLHAEPEDISDVLLSLHLQPRSSWSSEVDVRPWRESFWEHC